jgi:hypothetical protein
MRAVLPGTAGARPSTTSEGHGRRRFADSKEMPTDTARLAPIQPSTQSSDLSDHPRPPHGSLTLIDASPVPYEGGQGWPLAGGLVVFLMDREVRDGRPVVWIQCGGFDEEFDPGIEDLAEGEQRNPLICVVHDTDVAVTVPGRSIQEDGSARPVSRNYRLGVPTLGNIAERVAAHERVHGPAMVVFNEFESARPYWHLAFQDEGHTLPNPDRVAVTADEAWQWRADDIAAYAASRPDASTVAVIVDGDGVEELRRVAGLLFHP